MMALPFTASSILVVWVGEPILLYRVKGEGGKTLSFS